MIRGCVDHSRHIARTARVRILPPDPSIVVQCVKDLDVVVLHVAVTQQDRCLLHARHACSDDDDPFAPFWRDLGGGLAHLTVSTCDGSKPGERPISIAVYEASIECLNQLRGCRYPVGRQEKLCRAGIHHI
jgi:hypothetical protein